MSRSLRTYVRAKALLLAILLDARWATNRHALEDAYLDFINACEELHGPA